MITLPGNKLWTQENRGDNSGTLWSSFNLDLTRELGKTKVSPRMVITTNNITDLGTAVNFKIFNSKIWTVAGSYVFKTANVRTETAFAKDAIASTPTVCSSDTSDIEVYNSKLFVATDATLVYTDGASWSTATNGTTSASVFHKLIAFRKQNRMYLTDAITIYSLTGTTLTKSGNFTYTLNLSQAGLVFTTILQTDDFLWLLTTSSIGDLGYVIVWDGITQDVASKIVPLDSRGAVAGIVKDGTPYIMTVDAKLQYYNGNAFVDAPNGRLPASLTKYLKNPFTSVSTRWIHPNGITLVDGRINILVNNENFDNGTTINENFPSGIWEYDPTIGWYHKSSLSLYDLGVGTVTDYGQNRLSRVGALCNLKPDNNSSDTTIGTLLAGGVYLSDATTTANGIWTNDATDVIQKAGYLVTTKLFSPRIRDNFGRFFLRHKKLLNATDRIVIKYIKTDIAPVEGTITWLTTSSFNTALNLSGFVVGDEIEVTQGVGSGFTSHITFIQATDSGYMVSVDETYPTAITSKARFQQWKKIFSGTYTNLVDLLHFGNIDSSNWIKVKIWMLFTGNNEIYDMTVENKPQINIAPY